MTDMLQRGGAVRQPLPANAAPGGNEVFSPVSFAETR
jgi:hypothetical protein